MGDNTTDPASPTLATETPLDALLVRLAASSDPLVAAWAFALADSGEPSSNSIIRPSSSRRVTR